MLTCGPDPVTACCFRGGSPRRGRDEPPDEFFRRPARPGPPPAPRPLTPEERAVYGVLGGMGCFTFLALLAIIILAHSPLVAN